MGVDAIGYLRSSITAKDIYDVVLQFIDSEAEYNTYEHSRLVNVDFEYKGEKRTVDIIENTHSDQYLIGKLFDDDRYTWMVMSAWGFSVEVLRIVLNSLGGYIDEDDCDDIEPWETYIEADSNIDWNDYVKKQNKIIELIKDDVTTSKKIKTARLLIKYHKELGEILNS